MKLKLIDKRQEAEGTKSFFWETQKEIKYLPGQYFYFTLPKLNFPDPRGATRHFTLSSSPSEGKIIRCTTRIRQESGFKKTLDGLSIGSEIQGEGPEGSYILDENEKGPHVFLAGGIGITPFRSMIKYVVDNNLDIQIHLIYSNSIPEQIAFKKELADWSKKSHNVSVDMTVSKPEESKEKWSGLTGRVDEFMIKKLIENWKLEIRNLTFWLCGPPVMVDAMEQIMGKLKVSFGQVRSEKFTGY